MKTKIQRNRVILVSAVIVIMALGVNGCDLLDSHSLSPEQITALTNYADTLNAKLKVCQSAVNSLSAVLEAGGVLDANDISKLAKLNKEIDRITPEITAVSAAIREGQYSADEPDIINLLKVIGTVNQASAPWNPYAEIIAGVLFVTTSALGWLAKKKKQEADEKAAEAALATNTLKNVVTGVALSSDKAAEEVKSNIKNNSDEKALVASLKPEIPKKVA